MPNLLDSHPAPSEHPSGLTAVVVTHNSSAYVGRCLAALLQSVDDVVVVDNGSTDHTDVLVRKTEARLIRTGRNAGFAAACNIGIREATGGYALIVNPDAWPLGDAVPSLVVCAIENSRAAVIAPALVNEDGSHQRSMFGYPQSAFSLAALAAVPRLLTGAYGLVQRVRRETHPQSHAVGGEVVSVPEREFVSGAALLIRTDVIRELGGFDERFFFFSEEADLCFRVRDAGWSVVYCPEARFVHVGGASSPANRDWRYAELLRSYLLFQAKRKGVRRARFARRLLVAVLSARAAVTTGERKRCCEGAIAHLRRKDVFSPMA